MGHQTHSEGMHLGVDLTMDLELGLEVDLGPTMVDQWVEDIVAMAETLLEHRDTLTIHHGATEEGVTPRKQKRIL